MSAGGFCVMTPIYIADIADEKSRGQLVTYFHLLINCGIMYAFIIAHVLDEDSTVWRYLQYRKDTKEKLRLDEICGPSYDGCTLTLSR